MDVHLNEKQYDVLRYSYGLACDKLPAKEIAKEIQRNNFQIGTSY